ncbi:hypothetical protein Rxyl_2865 [Rubrobacter xylanophilus DSM 9941]|uniref:TIGR02611 family protein n=1 Tax=Rubrobacter xylanophilus (strain DSM 9941 / JCM 11954 / NBRC 16129 / PRD-1) TaxID=266117 RepID=Q1AS51_RUBXD|nr:hypothetical protein [Rubrobacter xylanophilus]ABG05777.1 hypothetical protein Rxyl_2865 [Rubrobacter xylanophilus DSM 9941]
MLQRARQSWRTFRQSPPGQRFQERYRRRQRRHRGPFDPARIFYVSAGGALALASALLGWAPGLGWVTFFIGLALVAGELRPVAVFLDWLEVRLRRAYGGLRSLWERSPGAVRVLISAAALACAAALGYGAYYLLFGAPGALIPL